MIGICESRFRSRRSLKRALPGRNSCSGAEVELEPERGADLLERLRRLTVDPEAPHEHVAHPRIEPVECGGELGGAKRVGRLDVWAGGFRVLDHVAVEALAVADGGLEADRILYELEQLLDARRGEARLRRDLV